MLQLYISLLLESTDDEQTESQTSQMGGDSSSVDDEGEGRVGKYHLRKTKPIVERFQVSISKY